MAGRVNTKFVVVLAVAIVVMVVGVVGLWAIVARNNPEHLTQQGDEFAEVGNWDKAVERYGRALRKKRDDVDLILKYTAAVEKLQTSSVIDGRKYIEQMLTWWQRASELDPNRPEPIEQLLRLYLRLGQDLGDFGSWDRMFERSIAILSVTPDSIIARKYRGIAQANRMRGIELGDEDRVRAREDLQAAIEHDQEDAETLYHMALWNLLEARRVSGGALSDPARAKALREEAVTWLVDALARHPEDRRRKLDLVTVLLDPSVADAQRAQPLVNELEQQLLTDPQPPQQVLAVSDLLMRIDRDPTATADDEAAGPSRGLMRAQALLKKASEVHPEDIRFRVAYGRALMMQQKIDEALAVLDEARKLTGIGTALEALRAADLRLSASLQYGDLLLTKAAQTQDKAQREKYIDEVDQVVRFLRNESGDSASVSLLSGKLDLARGDVGNALKRFSAASAQFRDQNPEALLLAARAAMSMREWGAAATSLQKLIALRPDLETARLELSRLYLQMQDPERARVQLQQVLRGNPDSRDAKAMMASLTAASGDIDAAIASMRKMGAEKDPRQSLQLAQLLMLKGQAEEARSLVAEVFEANPADVNVLQKLLQLTGDKAAALQMIQRSRDAGGDKRSLDFLQDQLEGDANIQEFVMDEINKIEDPLKRHLTLFGLYDRMGKRDQAKAELAEAAKLDADNATVVASQFNVALQEQDWSTAEKLASRAQKLGLDLADGLFYYGRLELARGRTDEAINSFRRGLMLRQTYSEGHRMLGDALRARSDFMGSIESYRIALEQKPDNVSAIRGQAVAYDAIRDTASALVALKKAVQFAPNDRQLLEDYLNYEMQNGDPKQVLRVRVQMAASNPGDADNRRALALLYAQQNDYKQAQQVIDELVAQQGMIRPNVGAAAAVKRAAGDVQGAVAILEEYIKGRGDKTDMDDYLLLGRFFMTSGLFDQALAGYRLAIEREDVATRPATRELADVLFDRNATEEALKLYEGLYQTDVADQRVALRYAETLLRLNRVDEAVKVLDAETKRSGESVEALLLRSLIAMQKDDKATAVKMLDLAVDKEPNRAMTYFQRAQARADDPRAERQVTADLNRALELDQNMVSARLLRAKIARDRGDTSGAILELRHILSNNPNFVQARLQLVDLYLNENRFNELQGLLDESAKLFPQEPTWPRIRAQVAERQNRTDEAIRYHAKAFELAPAPAHLSNLTLAMLKAGQAKQVLDVLDKHNDMVANVPTLLAVRGRALHATGKSAEGDEALALAVGRSANFAQLQSVTRQLRSALAVNELLGLLESAGGSLPREAVELCAAQTLMDESQWADALVRLNRIKLADLTPDSAERLAYLNMRALALYQTRAYDQAKAAYEQLNEAQPSNVGTLNNLAYLLVEDLNQPEQGLSLAEQAASLAPDNAQVLDTLGWAQFKAGQVEKAITTLRRSIRSQELPPNQFHLGRALMHAGDVAGAEEALNRAKVLAEQFKDESIRDQSERMLKEIQTQRGATQP